MSSIIKKAHQCLYFLRNMKRAGLSSSVLTNFYRCCGKYTDLHPACVVCQLRRRGEADTAACGEDSAKNDWLPLTLTQKCAQKDAVIRLYASWETHPPYTRTVYVPKTTLAKTKWLNDSFYPDAVCTVNTVPNMLLSLKHWSHLSKLGLLVSSIIKNVI